MNSQSPTPRSRLANELIKFAQADGVLEIHGLQVALIDAAIALDNAATLSARSEKKDFSLNACPTCGLRSGCQTPEGT